MWKIFTSLSFSWCLILMMQSLKKQSWMRQMHLNFLQLQGIDSFMGVTFSFAKSFVFCIKLCLVQSILASFFLFNKTFLQFFCSQNAQSFSEIFVYQAWQTYDQPRYYDVQQTHLYQPKLVSLPLPRHLQKQTLEFHLTPSCSTDHIVFPNVHICVLTFHFCLVDSWWQSPWDYWFRLWGRYMINYIVLLALHFGFLVYSWLAFSFSPCFIAMDHDLIIYLTNQPCSSHSWVLQATVH